MVVVPSKDTKILQFNQNQKHDKKPSIIHSEVAFLI